MKPFLLILSLFLLSCSSDKAKIEFDNNLKTITALSDDYGILDVMITESTNGVESDSVFSSVNLKYPRTKMNLKTIGSFYQGGMPLDELLYKKELVYRITLKRSGSDPKLREMTVIQFKASDIKHETQIFESHLYNRR